MVSEPPRPSVVTSFEVEVTPWNPATITTLPSARASLIRPARTSRMRALPCRVSVMMPAWEPVNDLASDPEVGDGHGQQRHGDALAGGQQHVHLAGRRVGRDPPGQRDQVVGGVAHGGDDHHDVIPGEAEATTRSATRRIRDASPTEVPPYFWTTRAMGVPCGNGLEAGGTSLPSRAEARVRSWWLR